MTTESNNAGSSATTPAAASAAPPDQPPSAPVKAKRCLEKHEAWSQFVGGMETMPVDRARTLAPKDMGVQFGPVMDEKQFEAYRKARGAGRVHVLKK